MAEAFVLRRAHAFVAGAPSRPAVTSVDVHPSGLRAVSGAADGALRFWDLDDGACLRTLGAHDGGVADARFLGDESSCVTSVGRDKTIRRLDLESGALLRSTPAYSRVFLPTSLFQRASGGHGVVLLSFDSTSARLVDADSGALLQTLRSPASGITAIAVDAAGEHAVTGGWNGRVYAWHLPSGTASALPEAHPTEVSAICISSDARFAWSGDTGGRVVAWELGAAAPVGSVQAHGGRVTALAHDGVLSCVVTGGADRIVALWTEDLGERFASFEAEHGITACALGRFSARREVGYRTSARPLEPALVALGDAGGEVAFLEVASAGALVSSSPSRPSEA